MKWLSNIGAQGLQPAPQVDMNGCFRGFAASFLAESFISYKPWQRHSLFVFGIALGILDAQGLQLAPQAHMIWPVLRVFETFPEALIIYKPWEWLT